MTAVASSPGASSEPRKLGVSRSSEGRLVVHLSGPWTLQHGLASTREVEGQLKMRPTPESVEIESARLEAWDSSLLTFLASLENLCRDNGAKLDLGGLPKGVHRLHELASAVPERKGARRTSERVSFLMQVGNETLKLLKTSGEMVGFLGEAIQVFGRFLRGRARFRWSDLGLIMQECGAGALPIVTLISLLVGLILGFVGAVQLKQFGAQIYVADLVGIATAREMGAMMTAIIMAGRTGAAFAAQLGTMQVNEEIDALSTLGLSPMEFLVLPRMLALVVMMPLLCIYADLMGILGGAVVGIGMLHLSVTEYFNETQNGIGLADFAIGIFKSGLFGVLIALSGCMKGMQCGRSASAVGLAATSAVVTGIVFIIVTDGLLAVITDALGI